MSEKEERDVITEVKRVLEEGVGVAPRGWMSPGANPSERTEDLLAEEGFTYTLDWPMDDQPVWMSTAGGPLLAVPYPHEINDVPAIVFHDLPARDFADMTADNVAEMVAQSKHQPLVCGIVLHSFIVGQPYRIRRFRDALRQIAKTAGEIWFTTPGEIAEHFAREVAPARVTTATPAAR